MLRYTSVTAVAYLTRRTFTGQQCERFSMDKHKV